MTNFKSFFQFSKLNALIFLSGVALTSCSKQLPSSCYEKGYHELHKNDVCTQDCPGVIGCDGKSYCNECIMQSHGIKKTN